MCCVNQFGEANNAKYYHAGVVQAADGSWWVYLEWGRMKSAHSWNGSFGGGDYQFVSCEDEEDARKFFAKQAASKNLKRLVQKDIGGKLIWTAKPGKDGYIVQRLATREKGLPDAYKIKDDTGLTPKPESPSKGSPAKKKGVSSKVKVTQIFDREVQSLANALVGGTQNYARALSAASGIIPTMDAILEVRDELVPVALQRISDIGSDIEIQVQDEDLISVSKLIAALVPRPIPRKGQSAEEAILSANNILVLQQDLDAFEAALLSEDFDSEHTATPQDDPNKKLNALLEWIPPKSSMGVWLIKAFTAMTQNRHSYIRGSLRIKNLFLVERPDRDAEFLKRLNKVAAKRNGQFHLLANLQPERTDLGSLADSYKAANVFLGIHGTRPVNIAPIMGTNFRLPKQLPGAQISGANFGHGIYLATDHKKAYGYTGRGYWGGGGSSGEVSGRGCFFFLCDTIMGAAYRAPSTGSWSQPPQGHDSIFGVGGDRGHRLENDEHIIFDPHNQRIRYLVEIDWMT